MTAAYRSKNETITSTPGIVTAPAGTVATDILLAYTYGFNSFYTITGAGGQTWTNVINVQVGGAATLSVWWAINNGSLGTVTFTRSSGSSNGVCGVLAYSSGDVTTPMDVVPVTNSTTGSPVSVPTITTVTDDSLRVVIAGCNNTNGPTTNFTALPSGMTTRLSTASSGVSLSAYVGDQVLSTHGASPAQSFTLSQTTALRWIGHLAIRPRAALSLVVAGAMTALTGTVDVQDVFVPDHDMLIVANTHGLNGGPLLRTSHPKFVKPPRKYIWVYGIDGIKSNVLD